MAKHKIETTDLNNMVTFVTSVDKVKFRQPVFPNDELTYSAVLYKQRRDHVFYTCGVYKDLQTVAQATIGLTAKKL
jgi:3-hydroxymyristoyl/3-hydroxydecanoyl-(acyl carrier protein) dehydratase